MEAGHHGLVADPFCDPELKERFDAFCERYGWTLGVLESMSRGFGSAPCHDLADEVMGTTALNPPPASALGEVDDRASDDDGPIVASKRGTAVVALHVDSPSVSSAPPTTSKRLRRVGAGAVQAPGSALSPTSSSALSIASGADAASPTFRSSPDAATAKPIFRRKSVGIRRSFWEPPTESDAKSASSDSDSDCGTALDRTAIAELAEVEAEALGSADDEDEDDESSASAEPDCGMGRTMGTGASFSSAPAPTAAAAAATPRRRLAQIVLDSDDEDDDDGSAPIPQTAVRAGAGAGAALRRNGGGGSIDSDGSDCSDCDIALSAIRAKAKAKPTATVAATPGSALRGATSRRTAPAAVIISDSDGDGDSEGRDEDSDDSEDSFLAPEDVEDVLSDDGDGSGDDEPSDGESIDGSDSASSSGSSSNDEGCDSDSDSADFVSDSGSSSPTERSPSPDVVRPQNKRARTGAGPTSAKKEAASRRLMTKSSAASTGSDSDVDFVGSSDDDHRDESRGNSGGKATKVSRPHTKPAAGTSAGAAGKLVSGPGAASKSKPAHSSSSRLLDGDVDPRTGLVWIAEEAQAMSGFAGGPDSAVRYRFRNKRVRDATTCALFAEYNTRVFGSALPSGTPVEWGNRLLKTAGLTYTSREKMTSAGAADAAHATSAASGSFPTGAASRKLPDCDIDGDDDASLLGENGESDARSASCAAAAAGAGAGRKSTHRVKAGLVYRARIVLSSKVLDTPFKLAQASLRRQTCRSPAVT